MISPSDDRQFATLVYVLALVGSVFFGAGWLVALVMWAMSRGQSSFRTDHAAQAFAIHAAAFLLGAIAAVSVLTIILIPIAILLGLGLLVMTILFTVQGVQASQSGRVYTVPVLGPAIRTWMH